VFAWQPLSPRGIAAFATAPLKSLLWVQFVFALIAALIFIWFLHSAWFPVITRAVNGLPTTGEFRRGVLQWPGDSTKALADNRFLALSIDLEHRGQARSPSDLTIELGHDRAKLFSLLGYIQLKYPSSWRIAFNHDELVPWWGAWSPALLAIGGGLLLISLMLSWAALATIYLLPAWVVGFLANREPSLSGSLRLCGASLMPGALFLTAGLLLYGLGALDLIQFGFVFTLHFLVGWVFVFLAVFKLPPQTKALPAEANPFVSKSP